MYNIAQRSDDALVDLTAAQGIAYVPYFPLGGFSPLQSEALHAVAARLEATPMSVALAWLLQRSPNILLIPGTSSVAHLRENVAGAGLALPADAVAEPRRHRRLRSVVPTRGQNPPPSPQVGVSLRFCPRAGTHLPYRAVVADDRDAGEAPVGVDG
ncbi:hypothetical protein GCM10025868_09240 [Angustibacter aerolatus]|uniref:NADP-dependent oxidoreductase domain-containing protein n=1 Tax=Angustibacter aerolatus TaxID=1162965 RepID=A0ABQ6JE32_9ACTN|nr:hypothetical protein GCM10025868_09240 [Angustibacter aerolatus]